MPVDPTIMQGLQQVGQAGDAYYGVQRNENDIADRHVARALQMNRLEDSERGLKLHQARDKIAADLVRMFDPSYDADPNQPGIQLQPGAQPDPTGVRQVAARGGASPSAGGVTGGEPDRSGLYDPSLADSPLGRQAQAAQPGLQQAVGSETDVPQATPTPTAKPPAPAAAQPAAAAPQQNATQALGQIGGANPYKPSSGSYSQLLGDGQDPMRSAAVLESMGANRTGAVQYDQNQQRRFDAAQTAMFAAIAAGQPGAAQRYASQLNMQLSPEDLADARTQQFAAQATKFRTLYGDDYEQFGKALQTATQNGGNWQAAVEAVPPRRKPLDPIQGTTHIEPSGEVFNIGRGGQASPIMVPDQANPGQKRQLQGNPPRAEKTVWTNVQHPDDPSAIARTDQEGNYLRGTDGNILKVVPTGASNARTEREQRKIAMYKQMVANGELSPIQGRQLEAGRSWRDVMNVGGGAKPGQTELAAQRMLEGNYPDLFYLDAASGKRQVRPDKQAQALKLKRDIAQRLEQGQSWDEIVGAAGAPQPDAKPRPPGSRQPPQASIDALIAHPDQRDDFDTAYGEGAAAAVLGE